jgi:hypothetical protein
MPAGGCGSGSVRAHVLQHRAQSGTRRRQIACRLSEEHPALQRGHQRVRELVGVGVGAQVAPVAHEHQAVAKQMLPPVKAGSQVSAHTLVAFRPPIVTVTSTGPQRI